MPYNVNLWIFCARPPVVSLNPMSTVTGRKQISFRCVLLSRFFSSFGTKLRYQAQFFRDPDQLETYLAVNQFLTSINNEISQNLNTTYADNLASLNNLVLVLFAQDKTVIPKETAWFGSYAPSNKSNQEASLIPMRLQSLYTEDRIGLKTLDERGGVTLETCEGEHMQLAKDCWEPLVRKFVGGTADTLYSTMTPEQVLRLQG
jgi:palmitoyl-protein thioesterase